MSTTDQDWSEAIKSTIENAESFANCVSNKIRQEIQADFLPTSSQSPGNSPQASPDSQQTHLPHAQYRAGICSNSKNQHISQPCTPPPNTSHNSEQATSSEKTSIFEPESQQNHCSADQQILPMIAFPKQNELSCSSNYPISKAQPHHHEFPLRNQSQSQGGAVNSSQIDKHLSTSTHPFSPPRQPHSQSSDHLQARLSTPHQSNQQRPPLNVSNVPQHLQATRMVSAPRHANIQQVRQSIPRQIQPEQPLMGGRQPQHIHQSQQRFPLQQQQQRPLNPGSSGASNMYLDKKMATPGFTSPTIRSQIRMPPAIHPQPHFPGQVQGARPVNQNLTQMNMTGQPLQASPPKRNDSSLGTSRIPQAQHHHQAFSNLHQQGMSQHKQDNESDEGMQQRPGFPQHGFEVEGMYYDEEEDDDDEEMDEIDEEMEYSGFHSGLGYGYPSSDSDELSEEESALLEELRCCEDDIRYEEIVGRLREKGVDPEEIEEMLCHSNYPPEIYPGENYDDGYDNEEEDEAEGTVSSSSQGQMSYLRNQLRPHGQMFALGGQNQSKMYPASTFGHNQRETSALTGVHGQQVSSGGFNHPGMSRSTPAVSPDGVSQHGKTSGLQGLPFLSQQKIPEQLKVPDSCPPVPTQSGTQGEVLQQQSELKLLGQGNQQKKVFQGSSIETGQPMSQTSGWQPSQSVVRAQSQLKLGDSKQLMPKVIPQPGQSQGLHAPRPSLMNKPPQPHSPAQGQIGAARPQGPAQSNPAGIVVRPVQHLTIMTNNNQTGSPGQGGQNRSLIVKQTAPIQQLVISSVPNNQLGGYVGTLPQTLSPAVRTACPRTPLQVPQKPNEQQGVPETPVLASGQLLSANRPVTPVSQSSQNQQGMVHYPRLKAVLDKDIAPSEASLARLKVMYMQQSLDQEIKAKKGVPLVPGQISSPPNPNTQNLGLPNRFPSPQNLNQFHIGQTGQPFHLQKQQNQPFPAYQPKHQLPPRQPIPAIVNPNSSTNQTSSGGRPICSVVPFTSQNRGPAISTNVQRQNTPQQNTTFVRPRNPNPLSPQHIGSSSQYSPGMLENRVNVPAVTHSPSSPSAGPPLAGSRSPAQGNTAPQLSNQAIPPQPVFDYVLQQQPQTPNVKSETISLDHLSEDKCIITGKGKQQGLTVNMIYQIRSPKDNSLVLASWNGERFEDLKQSDMKALGQSGQVVLGGLQPGQKSVSEIQKAQSAQHGQAILTSEKDRRGVCPSLLPDGNSKFQAEFMQSLTQSSEEDEQSYSCSESQPCPGQSTGSEMEQSPDRLQKTVADVVPNHQTTYVKPLSQVLDVAGQSQQKDESVEEDDDDLIFKKPFNENEDYFRVCQYCGYTSKNFKRCEGCKRVFQGEVKIHSLKKQTTKATTSSLGSMGSASNHTSLESASKEDSNRKNDTADEALGNVTLSKNPSGRGRGRGGRGRSGRTRGGGLRGRKGAAGGNFDGSQSDESSLDRKKNSDSSGSSSEGSGKKRQARPKSKNPTPRKRKKADEPVTLTISSDEDEPSSTSNNMANHAPSPASSAGSDSPLFPSTPAKPVNAFGRFRRALMEDEDGQSKLSKKIQQHTVGPHMDRLEDDEEEDDDDDEDGDEPPTYEIDIRSVRVGSMRTQPEGPLLINLQGVCFKVRSERTEEAFEFEIFAQDVEQVKFFSGQTQPVLFLFLNPECGEKLRSICHMEPGDDEYFDPSSIDMKQKMVVIIIECFNYMPHEMLRETLSLWADLNHVEDDCFIEELTEESANDLLIQSAPPVLTADGDRDVVKFKRRYLRDANIPSVPRIPGSPSDSTDNEPDSTSSSPPEIKNNCGPSIRLLQYPPAPARGIPITTEDLFCLTEGEFLNDVIIDFYLQYLYQEKLTEENRRRTHIFSSFFYKRLTQRDRHSEKTEEDAKKSLPERRHARVKKWTKTVDLFSKDFIIVPINEHSHWYLAVICFPGLANSEVVPFIPSVTHRADLDDESTDNTGEEKTCEDNSSQDTLPKTILGQQLNAKQCLDNEDSKYNLGQKQSCILMFDSLAGPTRTPNVRMLREYLQCEWNAKKSESRNIAKMLRGSTPKVPQQSNYSDCGVYLLQYVESFFEDPIADFQIPMKGLQNWFPEELVHNKRREIHDLIMSLHRRYQEERGDIRILDIKFESTPREPPMKLNPNPEMNSRPEEGMCSGYSRDDDNSNSSISGEMNRAELPLAAMPMEHNSLRAQGQLGNQYGVDRQKDDNEQYGSDDHDANDSDDINEKQRAHFFSAT